MGERLTDEELRERASMSGEASLYGVRASVCGELLAARERIAELEAAPKARPFKIGDRVAHCGRQGDGRVVCAPYLSCMVAFGDHVVRVMPVDLRHLTPEEDADDE